MITHNGKQVSIAMRNRKAINLIARNGKAMFGEFLADIGYGYGIDRAARAVILAEYGKQVWSDVRDYAKAHPAIVPFINQDPHLAASISPNSNKERWLVGDGASYFNTGVTLNQANGSHIRMKLQWLSFATNGYQVNGWGNNPQIGAFVQNGKAYWQNFATGKEELQVGKTYDVTLDLTQTKSVLRCDGFSDLVAGSATSPNDWDFLLFCMTTNGTDRVNFANEAVGAAEVGGKHFVPYRDPSTGEMELLDLVTLTLATRVGTFTEVIEDKP